MQGVPTHIVLLIVSTVISVSIGVFAYRKASVPAIRLFFLLTMLESIWTVGNLFELVSPTLPMKVFWDNVQWLPTGLIPPTLLAFGLRFSGRRLQGEHWYWRGIGLLTGLVILLAWSDPWFGWMRESPRIEFRNGVSELTYSFLPLHDAANLFILGQVLWSLAIIFQYFTRAPRLYRAQVAAILFGAAVPLVAGVLIVLDITLWSQRDILPVSFIALNLCVAWGLLGLRLFDVVPLARELLVESLEDPIAVLDLEDRILDLNPALRRILKTVFPHDPVGGLAWDVFARWPELLERFRESRMPSGDLSVKEAGRTFWFNLRVMPLTSRTGHPIGRLVIARDVTAQKEAEFQILRHRDRLEELVRERTAELAAANGRLRAEMTERERIEAQLRQGQKMEALGRLAGGVAHDLNNLLVPILNYTQLVMGGLDSGDRRRLQLEHVLKAAERAADLARQILAFSRRQVLQLVPLDLNDAVADIEGILRRLIGADIRFQVERSPHPVPVLADRSQLDQILVNLVVNARDAMPKGGAITIRTREENLEVEDSSNDWVIRPPVGGRFFGVEVADTGEGMDESTAQHVFEPFFTTKPEGKGTGLGLATVFGIVKQHGGALRLHSRPGRGTTVLILFPATDRPVEPAPATAEAGVPEESGSGTILVVDDEATVRSIASHILRSRGYTILEAATPEDAIVFAESHPNKIDLLLSDLVMPGMNGRTLADKVRGIRPGIRVLFVSGYSDGEMADRGLLDSSEHYLAKPFTADSLTRIVREVLRASS